MANVRNLQELGSNLQKIVKRLMTNEKLLKYLYYTDRDPLSNPNLTSAQKKDEVFEKLIKVVPEVGAKELATPLIVLRVATGNLNENSEFEDIDIAIESFVPLSQWIIKGEQLRPFAIMGEIQKSLNHKEVNGLGKMINQGFALNFMTEEISAYVQPFRIISYS